MNRRATSTAGGSATGKSATNTARNRTRGAWAQSASGRSWILLASLFLLAVVPYLGSLFGEFVFDDRGILLENPALWDRSPLPALASRYWPESDTAGLYRPVALCSYWLDGQLWGREPAGFHATNVLLHAIVTLLAFALFRRLFPRERAAAAIAAALLAVHPLRSEAVIAIVGRAELLAAAGAILSYWLALGYARPADAKAPRAAHLGLSAAALGLAMLSKESALGLLALPLFHATPFGGESNHAARRRWRRVALAWGVALVPVWLLRLRVLGAVVGLERVPLVDNPLAHAPALERIATALGLQGWVALSLLWPIRISADYSYPQLTATPRWIVAGAVVGVLAALAVWSLWRRPVAPLRWAFAFVVASGMLTANVVFPIGTVLGDRLTYLPTVGSLFAIAYLLAAAGKSLARRGTEHGSEHGPEHGTERARDRLGAALLAAWILALGVRAELRTFEWKTNLTLFEATTRAAPRSSKAWTNLSLAQAEAKRFDEAIASAEEARRLYPEYTAAALALGSALNQAGRPTEALPHLKATRGAAGRRRLDATLALGNTYLLLQEGARAESTFRSAGPLSKPGDPHWRIGLASALALQSRWPASRTAWQNAWKLQPEDAAVTQRFAYALWQAGAPDSAETLYRRALELSPVDPAIQNDFAWFLLMTERDYREARALAEQALARDPSANVADTLLEAILRGEGCAAARRWLDAWNAGGGAAYRDSLEAKLAERCPGGVQAP